MCKRNLCVTHSAHIQLCSNKSCELCVNINNYLLHACVSSRRRTVTSPVYHDGRNTCCDDDVSSTSHRTGARGDQWNTYTALQNNTFNWCMRRPVEHIHCPAEQHIQLVHEETSGIHTRPCRTTHLTHHHQSLSGTECSMRLILSPLKFRPYGMIEMCILYNH